MVSTLAEARAARSISMAGVNGANVERLSGPGPPRAVKEEWRERAGTRVYTAVRGRSGRLRRDGESFHLSLIVRGGPGQLCTCVYMRVYMRAFPTVNRFCICGFAWARGALDS